MIWTFQPYDHRGVEYLKYAYDECCRLVPGDNDWIVLRDADLMILTPEYEKVMLETADKHPEYDLWTCYTNRVMCIPQVIEEMFYEPDLQKHREKALELYRKKRNKAKRVKVPVSGYQMMFRKKTWKRLNGFSDGEGPAADTIFSRKVLDSGGRIGLMEGVYGFHYYRFNEGVTSPYDKKRKKRK